jgi:alpha-galactosidase
MAKIVLIGAGGFGWTKTLLTDMLSYPELRDGTVALVDIDAARLEMAGRICRKIIAAAGTKTRLLASTERRDVLKGADAVIITILCGGTGIWKHDILIPKKYGVDINVGDTRGPSGILRALRTIPTMVAICRDVERLCPKAIVLNYTNPMAMVCHAMQRETGVTVTGLCHSVQGTAHMLARWCGVPPEELSYVCAGLNHLSWFVRLEHKGRDVYPRLRRAVQTDRKVYNHEQVRNEMFLALGYYVTESSGHNSEYNAWFRKRPDLIERYCTHGTGWNPGEHAYILKAYMRKEESWRKQERAWLKRTEPIRIQRSHEYASRIINAWVGGEPFKFNGNVPNRGIIPNLPDYCVEVPVLASRFRLEAMQVGELPPQVMPLTANHAYSELMAVEACRRGDPELVYQSIVNDPLTAAVLSTAEIRKMTAEMLRRNRAYLPTFKRAAL